VQLRDWLGELRIIKSDPEDGKVVHVWAVQEDWDAGQLRSNTLELEWPPKSGRLQIVPELDRAAWFDISEARQKILKGQAVFIDRLLEAVRLLND
jgi:predicted NUDIX family NTP pyrophosphohydrolase